MPRKEYTIHYIYKITCTINGKYYIGMHSTFNLEDGYMGSGKRIKRSIEKHGLENHVKEILEFLKDRSSLKEREKELVNENLLKDSHCLNLQLGGVGGFSSKEHQLKATINGSKKASRILKKKWKDKEWSTNLRNKISETWKDSKYDELKNKFKNAFKDKNHTRKTKNKIKKSMIGKQSGSNNSQFGKTWITNGKDNMKIWRGSEIPEGWKLGRKIK